MGDRDRGADGAAKAGDAASVESLGMLDLAVETVGSVLERLVSVATTTLPTTSAASAYFVGIPGAEPVAVAGDEVRELDRIQSRSGRGPAVETMHTSRRANVAIASSQASWPEFAESALAKGFTGVLALPLDLSGRTLGVLILYSRLPQAYGRREIETAEALARQAAATIANAATLSAAQNALRDMEDSVATRGVIGQAQGLLMARHGCCGEAAFEMLRRASQVSNRKLHTVAAEIVAEHERGASA